MKKLLIIILILTLPLISYLQYKNYKRFHPPVNYDYPISDSVDTNYHDQGLVDEYFSKAFELGLLARSQWRKGVDVRYPDLEDITEMTAAKYYNRVLARTIQIERVLANSSELKNQGYTNAEIRKIENGMNLELVKWEDELDNIIGISFGERSKFVWDVQKKLISKGYEHQLDGLFGIDTQSAILKFQEDNNMFPSGSMNQETFDLLFLGPDN